MIPMGHKVGAQAPNAKPDSFSADDLFQVYGNGTYVLMQTELVHLARLRELAQDALILIRMYLEDWHTTDPVVWAKHCATVYRQIKHLTRFITWANEQNLRHESRGVIGAPGIEKWHYERIRDWNLAFIAAFRAEPDCADALLVFPALAYGHSDDQADFPNDPYVGLDILRPVIEQCDIAADHMYVKRGIDVMHRWEGLGRWAMRKPFFLGKKIWIKETGCFEVDRDWAAQKLVDIADFFDADPDVIGTTFFIHADPTKQHQENDMSRNPRIYDALRDMPKVERPSLDAAPVPAPVPIPIPDIPSDTPTGVIVGYQVWQWNQVATVGNLLHLERDMNQIGAMVLTDKYMDSDAFMGRFDNDPLAVASIRVMQDRRKWCEDQGRDYFPWDVPRAIPVTDTWDGALKGAIREAEVHAEVCNQVGLTKRVSDLEFYKSFFGYDLEQRGGRSFFPNHQARMDAAYAYYHRFKQLSDTKTILQPDPRQLDAPANLGGIDVMSLAKDRLIDEICLQSYAYWFMTLGDPRSHAAIVEDSIRKASSLGIPWGLTLYSEIGTPRDTPEYLAREMARQVMDAGGRYLFIYKAPVSPSLHSLLAEVSRTTLPEPSEPAPNPTPQIETLGHLVWSLAEQLEDRAKEARALGHGWAGNLLQDASRVAKGGTMHMLRAPKDS
jgi:hypothetical protein